MRSGLFGDPASRRRCSTSSASDYAEQLVADVARQFSVQTALGDGVRRLVEEAFTAPTSR